MIEGVLTLVVRRLPGSVYWGEAPGWSLLGGPGCSSPGKKQLCQPIPPLQPCWEGLARACGWCSRMGGGFLFKRQGGWNGGSQLAVGSISTDKALPCRCEEFQLNMQPICLCVGEGLLEGGGWRQRLCGIPANQKLAPFITGTRGFPQPSCALAGVARRRQTEEARERLGRRVPGWKGFRNF